VSVGEREFRASGHGSRTAAATRRAADRGDRCQRTVHVGGGQPSQPFAPDHRKDRREHVAALAHRLGRPARLRWVELTAVPQTAPISVVTRRHKSGSLNFASYSPEDDDHDRRRRSARLQLPGPKGLFQYRTAGTCAIIQWTSRRWPPGCCPARPARPVFLCSATPGMNVRTCRISRSGSSRGQA
jgi:hypothetical protein